MKKLLCLLMICVLFLCSCGKEEVAVNENFGGTLSLFAYEEDTINPLKTKYKTNAQVLSACMHRGLLEIAPNHQITCDLAESYSFSDDKTTVTFKLKDVAFSDGSKVKGEDVVKSLDAIKNNPESMYHVVLDFIESYSATDNSVNIKLYAPDGGVLAYMNFPVVKESGDSVLGAGYYKLSEIQSDRVLLEAADSLTTNYEVVKIMLYPKPDMAENAFLSNEIDVIDASFANLASLQGKAGIVLTEYVSDNLVFIGINTKNEILSDVNVRRAIACAFDKQEMSATLAAGYAKATNSPFKPDTIYGNLYSGEYTKDLDMFKEYLKNADVNPNNLTLKILINKDSITKQKAAQYLSKSLSDAGISASVDEVDFETYISRINNGEYTLFIGETTVSLNQDFGFLGESNKNVLGYESAEMDELFRKFRTETDEKNKMEIAKQLAKYFVDELPVISLYYQVNTLVTDEDVEGKINPMQTNIIGNINELKYKK